MKKILLLSFAAALLSACSSPTFTDTVKVDSVPTGADVFVNNEIVGQTPACLTLPSDGVYEIRLAKKGYKDEVVSLASIRQNPVVKFGPLVDLGFYKELAPAPVDAKLTPDFLPAAKGLNPFESMTSNIGKVDALRKEGKISAEEHSYLLSRITEFYSK